MRLLGKQGLSWKAVGCLSIIWLAGAIALPVTSLAEGASEPPCVRLKKGSAVIRAALSQINAPLTQRGTAAYRQTYANARKAIDTVQWPFSHESVDGYIFSPTDFDGDGKIDKMTASCGQGETRLCLLTFDRGDAKRHQLENGFMYLTRLDGRFYVAWDYHASPATISAGGPGKDFSDYYAVTSQGFSRVCNGKPM